MANISKIFSAELDGINARLIEVETDINVGLHSFTIVGLADKALSEAKERVNSALKNIGVKPPTRENRRIVVNLAPADIKKTGSQYDLAIALGYLASTKQIKDHNWQKTIAIGELSLDGKLRSVAGALSIAVMAKEADFEVIFLPEANAKEAAMVSGINIFPVASLKDLIDHIEGRAPLVAAPLTAVDPVNAANHVSINDIKGQEHAKRALMIAAAGGHNILFQGPPGTGKTMLAQALNSILPPPTPSEVIEMTKIWSVAGLLGDKSFVGSRPFRAPHHTASSPAIVGGGVNPRPGEISLAHRGVLFLDELPEFRRDLLEALRQPLESGTALVSRARGSLELPAKFMLVAAMNPCPCGYYGDKEKHCVCGAYEVLRYRKKISGPLLDRIDIQIEVPRISIATLQEKPIGKETGFDYRDKVMRARHIQSERLKGMKGKMTNAELSSKECSTLIHLTPEGESFLKDAFDSALISARGYYRILKVARTIADLENNDSVTHQHIAEAFSYRLREQA